MREFQKLNQIFIKSDNTTNKIFNRYLYCLIPFILLILIYNLIIGNISIVLNLLKSISISIITCIITQYIFNIIKKEKNISIIFQENNTLTISIIIGLFSINTNTLITILGSIVSIIIKNKSKNINLSSSLYGILLIIIIDYFSNDLNTPLSNLSKLSYISTFDNILTPYGNILNYIIGTNNYYLSPILSIISFIYLFHKKSIKYNIIFSYILTFSIIMLFIGILNNMNIWYVLFQLTTGNILFLSVFCLTDYPNTPTIEEGQIIYGIVLGLITSILRFIIPELSVVIPLLLGPILLTKIINNLSYKLKYNKKYYNILLTTCIFLIIITTTIINIVI